MRKIAVISFVALLLAQLLWAGNGLAKSPQDAAPGDVPAKRVALLCEGGDAGMLALVEQVEVQLSTAVGVEVLDRANIQKVLQEQALSVEQATVRESAVKIGKVLRADVLVAVSLRDNYIAWRIMNTADGRLLRLHIPKWPLENREEALAQAVASIKRGIVKARAVSVAPLYVAVARFVSQDISRQYDALEGVLPELVSARLADEPSVVMVERAELPKIEEELMQTAGAGGGFRASTLLVEGLMRVTREDSRVTITVGISAGKPGSDAMIRFTCEGADRDVIGLARGIAERLLREMGDGRQQSAGSALADEADVFFRKGRLFDSQKAYAASVPLYETACALAPTNRVYREATRDARRLALISRAFAPEVLASFYVQEANECERAFRNNLPSAPDLLPSFQWLSSQLYGWVARERGSKASRESRDAYLSALDAVAAWHQARDRTLHINDIACVSRAVLSDGMLDDPIAFRREVRRIVDLLYAAHSKQETDHLYQGVLVCISMRALVRMQGAPDDTDRFLESLLDEFAHDSRPLVSLLAAIASCRPVAKAGSAYKPPYLEMTPRPDAVERMRAAVRRVAAWTGPGLSDQVLGDFGLVLAECDDRAAVAAMIRDAFATPGCNAAAMHGLSRHVLLVLNRPGMKMKPGASACAGEIAQCLKEHDLAAPQVAKPAIPSVVTNNLMPALAVAWQVDVYKLLAGKLGSLCAAMAVDERVGYFVNCGGNVNDGSKPNCDLTVTSIDLKNGSIQATTSPFKMPFGPREERFLDVTLAGRMLWIQVENRASFIYSPENGIQQMTSDMGLPVAEMRSWTSLKGRCFLGCAGGFGEWVPAQRRFSMICSSRAPDDRHPLAGGTLYEVVGMAADEPNQRLILAVSEGGKRNGLWEYALTNGVERQLVPLIQRQGPITFGQADANYVYVRCDTDHYTLAYDFLSPEKSILVMSANMVLQLRDRLQLNNTLLTYDVRHTEFLWNWPFAAKGGNLVYGNSYKGDLSTKVFQWPKGASAERQVRLVDKESRDLLRQDDRIPQYAACRYGIVYRVDGRVGLMSELGGEGRKGAAAE